jgi:hypothetical protein
LIVRTIEIVIWACLLYQADIDNSGTIDYGEFLAATLHMNKLEREESLVSAFAFFDKDGSGFITIDELSQACEQFGLSDVHLEDMIKDVDQNNVSLLHPSCFSSPSPYLSVASSSFNWVLLNYTSLSRMAKLITVSLLR